MVRFREGCGAVHENFADTKLAEQPGQGLELVSALCYSRTIGFKALLLAKISCAKLLAGKF